MKKILSAILLALPMLAVVSCDDDGKSLPDVDFNFEIENAVRGENGALYVVQGENLEIKSIQVINKDKDKNAMITAANYYWDYYYIGSAIQPPYGFEIEITDNTPVGAHLLQVEAPLFAEDKEAATAVVTFNVEVVPAPENIPDGGTTTFSVHPHTANTADK